MVQIKKLKINNTTIYPVTHADAVWASSSYKLSHFIGENANNQIQNSIQSGLIPEKSTVADIKRIYFAENLYDEAIYDLGSNHYFISAKNICRYTFDVVLNAGAWLSNIEMTSPLWNSDALTDGSSDAAVSYFGGYFIRPDFSHITSGDQNGAIRVKSFTEDSKYKSIFGYLEGIYF